MAGFEDEVRKANVKGIITGAIVSALGFLVALQWNAALSETVKTLIPSGQGLFYLYVTAITVTAFAVFLAYIIIKIQSTRIRESLKGRVKKKGKTTSG